MAICACLGKFKLRSKHQTPENAWAVQLPMWQVLAVLCSGAAHAFSTAAPFSYSLALFPSIAVLEGEPLWWLQVIAMGVLALLLTFTNQQAGSGAFTRDRWRAAALLGWLFATAWLACTFWWTFVALHTYGGLPAVLGVFAVLALAGLLALYYAVACAVFALLAPRHPFLTGVVFASLWLLAELARGVWFTGFGWGAAGYAHVDGPLAPYAPWVGAYGLCFISAWVVMALVHCSSFAPRFRLASAFYKIGLLSFVLVLPSGLDLLRAPSSESAGGLSVTLLQGNIPQDEKFEPGSGVPLALQWYAEQLQKTQTALVVAPETAIPLLPQQLAPEYWSGLQQRFASGGQAALIGMPLGNSSDGYTNSVVGFKPGQLAPWRYDKHHLVPFGEFIPPFFKWFTELMRIPLGDFNRGSLQQPAFEWQGQRLAANICYEDLFGEELAKNFSDRSRAPTIFVNVSNLAWFGNSLAMDQHLQIARLRALEFERPFVLATNTGVTAIVDHRGRLVSSIPRNTRGVLVGEVEGRNGITPFAGWISRFGLWPYWLFALSVVALAAATSLRKR